jgi:soluble lytic murein transglycosylase-like protein
MGKKLGYSLLAIGCLLTGWWILNKTQLVDLIKKAAVKYSLDWRLMAAMAWQESRLNPNAYNFEDPKKANDDSVGLFQVRITTAAWLEKRTVTIAELKDPAFNSLLAAQYLAYQLERYGGSKIKAVAAYNAGTYKEKSPGVPINKNYVRSVMNLYEGLCELL